MDLKEIVFYEIQCPSCNKDTIWFRFLKKNIANFVCPLCENDISEYIKECIKRIDDYNNSVKALTLNKGLKILPTE